MIGKNLDVLLPHRHTLVTLLLLLVLVPPLLLITLRSARFEPFPALILPGGPQVAKVGIDVYAYRQRFLLARPTDGANYEPLDLNGVFPRLKATRIQFLMRKGWGLDSPGISERDKQEIRSWLTSKLVASGYAHDTVQVQLRDLVIDQKTGELARATVVKTNYFPLD